MRRTAIILFLITASKFSICQESLLFQPQKPQPGQTITITYNPGATPMLGIEDFDAYAYLLVNNNMPVALEIPVKKEGNQYIATIQTNDTTKAVFVTFVKGDKRDNNSDKGYYTLMYDKEGNPVQGANLAVGYAFNGTGGLWGLQRNTGLGTQFIKKEFEDPASVTKFKNDFLAMLARSKEEADRQLLKTQLDNIALQSSATEEDLNAARSYYEWTFKDTVKANALKVRLEKQYPSGNWKKTELFNAFYKENDPQKKEAIYQQLVTSYPAKQETDQTKYDFLARDIATFYSNKGNMGKADEYLNRIQGNMQKAQALNGIAWKMSGEGIDKQPTDVAKGKELSARSLELMKESISSLKDKPSYFTGKQWKENLEGNYGMFLDTYATLLYQDKDYEKAYENEKQAVALTKNNAMDINTTYTNLVEKVKGKEAAQKELENFLAIGKVNTKMKDQLKTIYLSDHSEAQWNTYIANFEKASLEKTKQEVAKQMINMPAPAFKLKDINGNTVSLASLKGKTIVVDFWATWCGPCKASFPGMQKTVNKYRNDPNVVFLFIDTWETDKNREKLVKDFIQKNKYTFTVLYDETRKNSDEYGVIGDYKVEGIPTKFVIDKNNNIKFKAVGFNGNDDALVEELSTMIEMTRNNPASQDKKTF